MEVIRHAAAVGPAQAEDQGPEALAELLINQALARQGRALHGELSQCMAGCIEDVREVDSAEPEEVPLGTSGLEVVEASADHQTVAGSELGAGLWS